MKRFNELKDKVMEDLKKKSTTENGDKEIIFSKAVKAGKRIYYLDVKKNRKDEMYVAITESKKVVAGEGENPQVSFEKHKIFLYKEDFGKFMHGLQQVIEYIEEEQGLSTDAPQTFLTNGEHSEDDTLNEGEIKIDIDF